MNVKEVSVGVNFGLRGHGSYFSRPPGSHTTLVNWLFFFCFVFSDHDPWNLSNNLGPTIKPLDHNDIYEPSLLEHAREQDLHLRSHQPTPDMSHLEEEINYDNDVFASSSDSCYPNLVQFQRIFLYIGVFHTIAL